MARKKRTAEEKERRAKVRELLQMANIGSMDDIQSLFKEAISEFMENGLELELDNELGYSKYDYKNKDAGNSRNGHSSKTLHTSVGPAKCATTERRGCRVGGKAADWKCPGRMLYAAKIKGRHLGEQQLASRWRSPFLMCADQDRSLCSASCIRSASARAVKGFGSTKLAPRRYASSMTLCVGRAVIKIVEILYPSSRRCCIT